MNNIFKKEEVIKLDSKYFITTDGFNGVCLVERTKKERVKKDGTKELIDSENKTYHANLGQALQKYFDLAQKEIKNLDEIQQHLKEINTTLTEFKNKYKNWV